jgi:ATP synthase protein I
MPEKQPNLFFKYSGMAIQMAAIIGLCAWGGQKLDARSGNKTPVYTIVLCLLGIIAALYLSLKDFINPKN